MVLKDGAIVEEYYMPLRTIMCGCDDVDRSFFGNHMYVINDDLIFDACAGPSLGVQSHSQYLNTSIDHSTTNECLNGYFSPLYQSRSEVYPRNIPLLKRKRGR